MARTISESAQVTIGQHVGYVKAIVPAGQWCPGHPKAERTGGAGGWLSKLTGRGR